MNIVIVGAGALGFHCAQVLSKEENNVTIVDRDAMALERISRQIDVATYVGNPSDWQILEELTEFRPDCFLALTDDDQENLNACVVAKNLGYARSVCAIRNPSYLNCSRLDFARLFYVDHFVCPDLLTMEEIYKCIIRPSTIASESFAHGAVQMRTFLIPQNWRKSDRKISDLNLPKGLILGLICRKGKANGDERKNKIIFPHGDDNIFCGDEVTLIGEEQVLSSAHQLFGITQHPVKSALIVGGSKVACELIKRLERLGIESRLIEKDYAKCVALAEELPNSTVLHHDGSDLAFLESEKVGKADVFVAATSNDEMNLLVALLAKEASCPHVIAVMSDSNYIPILKKLGIYHAISPRICAVNRILSAIQQEKVASIVSLYENRAEVMEIKVSTKSKVTGIPIMELGPQLPRDFLIAIIQNRGRIMVANGKRILSPGDTVIAMTHPKHLKALKEVF